MSGETETFDVPALVTVCARWPAEPLPSQPVADALFERLRQVLTRLLRQPTVDMVEDLLPLVRHVLLRTAGEGRIVPWLRVPAIACWPTVAQWEGAQFVVLDDGAMLRVSPRFPRLSFLPRQADLYDDVFLGVVSRAAGEVRGDPLLRRALGLSSYTGEGQREAVRALLQLPPGDTLIANLPTGSGKSLLAQLPPLLEQEGMLTLAIVPTVALAIDQAERMKHWLVRRFPHREQTPLAYHGGLLPEERKAVRRAIRTGTQPILFTSPEFATGHLRSLLEEAAASGRLTHVVIDEAHLVIGWGNGFRPAFQLLPALVGMLRERSIRRALQVVLASATLTASTIQALRQLFGPVERTYVVSAVHLRPEIRYAFHFCDDTDMQRARVLEAVRLAPRPFILYVTTPEEADTWLRALQNVGLKRASKFSGVTSASEREVLLKKWAANELDGMVATSAFGLGVDKSDVRSIIHATLPESLDRYYQEVGRAGRDGSAGASLLLHTLADLEQARGMASTRLISDERGFERWSMLIDHARPDPQMEGVFWVELERLPPHLRIRSEASTNWNVRALTLMARAGLIQLVALKTERTGTGEEIPQSLDEATHAAIRILDDGHRDAAVFAARMQRARKEVWDASNRGVTAMERVASGNIEISDALRQTYSVNQGVWAPVTACCGGCPQHWEQRRETVRYRPAGAPRLQRFARRSLQALERVAVPRAAAHLLVVDVPSESRYAATCMSLVEVLAGALQCHTWALEANFAQRHLAQVEQVIARTTDIRSFVELIDAARPETWRAGDGEVRVILWDEKQPPVVPDALWLSSACLEILVIPADLPHPRHSGRRLIDTTPHMHAADLMAVLSL